jgi:DNA-binding HxlR family transcriptional regulator
VDDEPLDWPAARRALDIISPQWVPAILAMLAEGPYRNRDFGRRLGVGSKALGSALQKLVAGGVIERDLRDGDGPTAILYRLTPRGVSLVAQLRILAEWDRRDRTSRS